MLLFCLSKTMNTTTRKGRKNNIYAAGKMDVKIDVTNIRLKTDRLILRPWTEDDLNDFYEYASVEGVGEMAGWRHHDSMETSQKVLQSFIVDKNVFAVVYKANGKVIGSVGLHESWADSIEEYSHLKIKEIGYALSKAYWGKGLMPEAVKKVAEFCFQQCELDAVTVGHFSDNIQSKRVIEKCGFQFVKQREYYAAQLDKSFLCMNYILYR